MGHLDLLLQDADGYWRYEVEVQFEAIDEMKPYQPDNFIIFRLNKRWGSTEPLLKRLDETRERLEAAGMDVMDHDEYCHPTICHHW